MKIGIIGQGFVGNAVYQKLKNFYTVLTYDINPKICNSNFEELLNKCSIIYTCLPTPMNKDGSCNLDILDSVLSEIDKRVEDVIIVNKSTVSPGTTDFFNEKYKSINIVFNPEFLTERNAVNDFNNQTRIILGGPRPASGKIKSIYSNVFPGIHIVKTGAKHAEMVKYITNCFLAIKVSFANEFYQLCNVLDLDYDKVIEYAILDKRLGKSHWAVPGPDGDFGFGGHCFPKDLSSIVFLTDKLKTTNNILKSSIKTNDSVRKIRDWEKMKGRAVI